MPFISRGNLGRPCLHSTLHPVPQEGRIRPISHLDKELPNFSECHTNFPGISNRTASRWLMFLGTSVISLSSYCLRCSWWKHSLLVRLASADTGVISEYWAAITHCTKSKSWLSILARFTGGPWNPEAWRLIIRNNRLSPQGAPPSSSSFLLLDSEKDKTHTHTHTLTHSLTLSLEKFLLIDLMI